MNEPDPPPSPAAERMRRYRERRRERLRCLMIELRETEIDALIDIKLLKTEMRNDANAIVTLIGLIHARELKGELIDQMR